MALIAVVVVPLVAAFLCWLPPLRRIAWHATVLCQCIEFVLALTVSAEVIAQGRVIGVSGWFEADGLGAIVILVVSFVCALAAIFAGGYMNHSKEQGDNLWWFYSIYNLFVFALVVVP
ncbi:MAG: hypothetical protein WBD26_12605, partial [Candidatus Acidiferrales bacterium]